MLRADTVVLLSRDAACISSVAEEIESELIPPCSVYFRDPDLSLHLPRVELGDGIAFTTFFGVEGGQLGGLLVGGVFKHCAAKVSAILQRLNTERPINSWGF